MAINGKIGAIEDEGDYVYVVETTQTYVVWLNGREFHLFKKKSSKICFEESFRPFATEWMYGLEK